MSGKLKDFDPEDEVSYYYGNLNRDHVKEILADASIGTFLIRDSTKDFDQKVKILYYCSLRLESIILY